MNTVSVNETWRQMWRRLAIVIPLKIVTWLDQEKQEVKRNHPLTILIILLIAMLSAASVTNLYTRADSHHAGISAYATGAGLALLVPIAIFFAVYVPLGKYGRPGVWAIALVFASISAAIQYNIYAPKDGSISIEAIAFGAGIPVAECLLAVLEGILINYLARQAKATEQAETAKIEALAAQVKADEQARQDREEAKRKADEHAKALEAQQAQQFAFEMEAKRARLELELELERKKLEAKLNAPPKQRSDSKVIQMNQNSESDDSDESRIIKFYRLNPLASQRYTADELGLSQSKVNRIMKKLKTKKVIHVNGNGVEVLKS